MSRQVSTVRRVLEQVSTTTATRGVVQSRSNAFWPLLRRVAVVGLIVIAAYTAHGRLYVNLSRSLPIGVYRRLSGAPQRGDIVVACLPTAVARLAVTRRYVWAGTCPGNAAPIGKKVIAMSGDTVEVLARGVAVNGGLIEHTVAVARDGRGRGIERVANGRYVVRENQLWLLSTHHPLSYDSRYFGPIDVAYVVSRVRPLWLLQ